MTISPKTILRFPAHPWLVGAFPILYLYSQNFGLVLDSEVPVCIFWAMVATSIGFFAAYIISRKAHRAGLITSSVSLLFSLSGHVHSLMDEREPLIVWTALVLIGMAVAVAELQRIRSERFFEQITLTLNPVALALVLMQAAALYSHRADRSNKVSPVQHGELSFALPEPVPKVQDSPVRPDIYYIIPDGYSSDAILQHGMNYANTMFTDALKSRGFEVIPHAQTNYHKTLMSLASTLNMRFYSANPTELSDQDYMRHVIAYNEVARYLLQLGYTNVQLLSGYLFPSALADINRDFTPSGPVDVAVSDNELATVLLDSTLGPKSGLDLRVFYRRSLVPQYIETTLLKPVAHELYNLLQRDQFASYDLLAPERFLDTLVELESIADMPEATFTLVHLLKPHLPVAFDNHGNVVAKKKNASPGSYLSQLEFLNRRFIEMVDKILESSRHQPVIIFQADHGSRHDDLQSDDERPMAYFDVYAAYLVPDQYSLDVPRPHTNINTFPLILNEVFDADFEFLDNHLIHLQAKFGFFSTQEDVTELLTHR